MGDPTETIKKIEPDNASDSILVPKIEVAPKESSVTVDPIETKTDKIINPKKHKKLWVKLVFGFLIFLLAFLIYNAVAGFLIYKKGIKLVDNAKTLSSVFASQDMALLKTELGNTKLSLAGLTGTYKLISWEKFLPFVGKYISDGSHILSAGTAGLDAGETVLTVIEPYADLLGFKSGVSNVLGVETSEQTTQDRINFIVNTIPDLIPQIDQISEKVKIVQSEIDEIDPEIYPEEFKGIAVRSKIESVQDLINEASGYIVNAKPFLESAPYLLGMDSPRTYLVLFQNDKELRPTGGFMTGYSIMTVKNATFTPVSSDDIYTLDAKYTPSLKAPEPIINYIKGPYALSSKWRLRDMNWSPDFEVAMETFIPAAEKAGIDEIDGVIAVDTHLLVNLLNAIGEIGVPGYGNFSTKIVKECNCAQVIYELESFADVEGAVIWDPLTGKIISAPANYNNRKAIIGPLMNSIMANALAQPKEKIPGLVEAIFNSLDQKHVLLYMLDENVQTAVSNFGLSAKIADGKEGQDYLHINDANLGGRKSNLYAYEEVVQDIEVGNDGSVTKTLTVTYQNPEKQDGWLNSILPTWVRVYVPQGSELLATEGLEKSADPYEELGKTVFAGYFALRPEGVSKVTFKYKLPFKVSDEYRLLVQKQPGTDGFLYTINLGKRMEEFKLTTDKEIKIEL